jgi:arginine exporter protein ArgO
MNYSLREVQSMTHNSFMRGFWTASTLWFFVLVLVVAMFGHALGE